MCKCVCQIRQFESGLWIALLVACNAYSTIMASDGTYKTSEEAIARCDKWLSDSSATRFMGIRG